MIYSKKAVTSILVIILATIMSGIVMFMLMGRMLPMFGTGVQQQICRANIVGANRVIHDSSGNWVLDMATDGTARRALRSPLCTTQVDTIDLRGKEGDGLHEALSKELGSRIVACWNTFGRGSLRNTFGQLSQTVLRSGENYYFSCYMFKIRTGDMDRIPTSLFFNRNSYEGLFWDMNAQGVFIDDEDRFTKSIAGEVHGEGYGYISFASKVSQSLEYVDILTAIYGQRPDDDVLLEHLEPERFYEIRYYSPAIIQGMGIYENVDAVFNNIKIVPATVDSAGSPIMPASIN